MSRKRGLSRTLATGERQYSVFQAAFNLNRSLGNDRLGLNCGSSGKWSDSTWTHRRQLEQLLQQVTMLRGDIASSRPMLTKGCCKRNNYEQNLSLDFSDEPKLLHDRKKSPKRSELLRFYLYFRRVIRRFCYTCFAALR